MSDPSATSPSRPAGPRRRGRAVTLRDPIWDTIRLDPVAVRVVDAAVFQRLRYIKQLGLAHLVYPGAVHTRFDHAIGVYHLAGRALSALGEQRGLRGVEETECRLIPLAGLLHDIGHYPFSHAIEELAEPLIPGHHEAMVGRFLADGEVRSALESVAPEGAEGVEALVRGRSANPLQGLVSGSLDLDKIEYLRRDARFCGVPYGEVDSDRLLYALVVVEDPATGRLEVGVREKGLAALESLLFAKYQMFRNVYWHHAVRAATAMYKRIVADALEAGLLESEELVGQTDEGLLYQLESRAAQRAATAGAGESGGPGVGWLVGELRARRLPKRAAEVVAADLGEAGVADWLAADTPLKGRVEDRIAADLGLRPGDAYLDYPEKTAMFGLDLLVERRSGEVFRLGPSGRAGLIGLPQMADALYQTARVLRLFTHGERKRVAAAALARLAGLDSAEVTARLGGVRSLL